LRLAFAHGASGAMLAAATLAQCLAAGGTADIGSSRIEAVPPACAKRGSDPPPGRCRAQQRPLLLVESGGPFDTPEKRRDFFQAVLLVESGRGPFDTPEKRCDFFQAVLLVESGRGPFDTPEKRRDFFQAVLPFESSRGPFDSRPSPS